MHKKFFVISLSAVLLLSASSTLAAYTPGFGMMGWQYSTANSSAQPQDTAFQKMRDYMDKLQNGNLTAADQKDMYSLMTAPATVSGSAAALPMMGFVSANYAGGTNQFFYRGTPFSGGMMYGVGNQGAWYQLMYILTVVLLWAVLLLAIAALYKWIKHSYHQR